MLSIEVVSHLKRQDTGEDQNPAISKWCSQQKPDFFPSFFLHKVTERPAKPSEVEPGLGETLKNDMYNSNIFSFVLFKDTVVVMGEGGVSQSWAH